MKEEIKDILEKLKDSIKEPFFIGVDELTEEAYEVPNYFTLDPTNGEIKIFLEYIENLQSQLKAKEEVIQNARLWINRNIKSCTIEATSTTTNDICKMTLFSLNKLDEILSKGENK